MHFLITAYDGRDAEAPARRQAARAQHLEGAKKLHSEGKLLYAAAILDADQNMIGSVMIVDFASKETLAAEWLDREPYVTGNVWQKIDIKPCAIPPFILNAT